jgi:hypothetical protein
MIREPATGGLRVMPEPNLNFMLGVSRRAPQHRPVLHRGLRNIPQEAIIAVTQTTTQTTRPPHQDSPNAANKQFPGLAAALPRLIDGSDSRTGSRSELSSQPPAPRRYDEALEVALIRRYPHMW